MRHFLATLSVVVGIALFGGSPAATAHQSVAVAAKTCPAGYVHAVIGGQQKCLHRGEFCAHRYQRQYQRYGFSCTEKDSRGNYHLT